jgi:RecB family exonuclease
MTRVTPEIRFGRNAARRDVVENAVGAWFFARSVGRRAELSRRHARGGLVPMVATVEEWATDAWMRFGDGRAVLPDRALARVASKVYEHHRKNAAFASLGDPNRLGPHLAALWAAVELTGDPLDGAPHPRALRSLLDGIGAAARAIPGFLPRPDAQRALIDSLRRPTSDLAEWLARPTSVVFDDLGGAPPASLALFAAFARAFADAGARVVVQVASPGLGAVPQDAWFTAEDAAMRSVSASRAYRAAIFDALLAEGDADVVIAGPDGRTDTDPEPPDAADAWLGRFDGAYPAPRLAVWRHASPRAEARAVADDVRRALQAGVPHPECVVAVTAGPRAAVRAALVEAGIPLHEVGGTPLSAEPLTRVVRRVARVASDGWLRTDLVGLLKSELCPQFRELGVDVAGVLRVAETLGFRSGRPDRWPLDARQTVAQKRRVLLDPARHLAEVAGPVFDRLEGLDAPGTAAAHTARLLDALDALGVARACVDGPPDAAERCGRAYGALVGLILAVRDELSLTDPGPIPAAAFRAALDVAVESHTLPAAREERGAVALIDVNEAVGLSPRRLWLVGLGADDHPGGGRAIPLVPPSVSRRLAPDDPIGRARSALARAVRDATGDGPIEALVLSWSTTAGDGSARSPSPVVAEMLDRGSFPDHTPRTASRTPIPADPERAVRQARAWADRRGPARGVWDGVLDPPPAPPSALAVGDLELWLRCPQRYWYARVLRLDETTPWTGDVAPQDVGTALHAALERFVDGRLGSRIGAAPLSDEARDLHGAALAAFADLGADGAAAPAVATATRDALLAGLIDDRPGGPLLAWLLWERGRDAVPEALETPIPPLVLGGVRVVGTADRVDRTAKGRLVLDYKSGRAPEPRAVQAGAAVQPAVYALALGADHGVWVGLKRADDLKEIASPPVSQWATPLHRAAGLLKSGVFHTTPHDPDVAGCPHCPFRSICRHDGDRPLEGDVHRPFDAPEVAS